MEPLGLIKREIDLRTVWKNEALDFTPWLAQPENLKLLSDEIGIDIELEETEAKVESFRVDLVGKDTDGKCVIIENQIEESDHKHLGQLITYAAGRDAKTIIWIVKHACQAHRAAVEWLNNHVDEDVNFFLIEVELWRIDDSKLAPKFNIVEQPNDWAKMVKKERFSSTGEAPQMRWNFWSGFNEYAFGDPVFGKAFKLRRATDRNFYDLAIGSSKFHLVIVYTPKQEKEITIKFYIRQDKLLFKRLFSRKEEIESLIGEPLEWVEYSKSSQVSLSVWFDPQKEFSIEQKYDWVKKYTLKFKEVFTRFAY